MYVLKVSGMGAGVQVELKSLFCHQLDGITTAQTAQWWSFGMEAQLYFVGKPHGAAGHT